ncbi:16S rRNA (guanine(966)-N(2))-methyltransferase RsmD [Mycoplasmopsis pullorum]|uniref:16S rRNA (guanine(966)-N(2))-methyltransferase RsmD n=1 Tax=Mycoplasmopsis pullorum TaxID=48003 RepID=UPI001118868F|nr:16S rRNA (guanine(966)-N(2))-methyltransferase RsmD [Mycoplasmopsis pullorum]TNK82019.1 16S rRNA (guanine(966)-N(2))-methyltransferase RsmD [Mycoplasmopsis pullorum]TNK82113.1 16S rRNA (guanine(966)-N(2))-methyltransferase RsmD [Mycoplasmopsis pullorum]TNK83787.1 16S rRNA (guanine(966)-N(2))-methyltransferase RsmD [Mycoplasmopsis pullorum]TNK84812.1 16S rRNA (guanine(966)-N(2))-methyltransferase RsmD [Mycoplasmopsis pullorum]TNK84826.1 16S rRNA (guanine(966)-N(2))-methyltransferase RsmD [My
MLRIISGKYGGRKINQPSEQITRPTTDKVREAVFSSIHFNLEDSIVLDLFSGSGAWSIEAVSRGAMKAIAVEKNRSAFSIIKSNLELLKINNIDLYNEDANRFLDSKKGIEVDFIFMDAPYVEYELINTLLNKIKEYKTLKSNGVIIIETDNPDLISLPKDFIIQKQKKYGKIHILYIVEFTN